MRKSNPVKVDLWMSRIMACRESGLSDSTWCRENDIVPSTFYYWIKKLRMEACTIPAPNHDVAIPFKQDVVPLRLAMDVQIPDTNKVAATAIIIKLEGLSLEIQNGANEQTISNTINALRQLC